MRRCAWLGRADRRRPRGVRTEAECCSRGVLQPAVPDYVAAPAADLTHGAASERHKYQAGAGHELDHKFVGQQIPAQIVSTGRRMPTGPPVGLGEPRARRGHPVSGNFAAGDGRRRDRPAPPKLHSVASHTRWKTAGAPALKGHRTNIRALRPGRLRIFWEDGLLESLQTSKDLLFIGRGARSMRRPRRPRLCNRPFTTATFVFAPG